MAGIIDELGIENLVNEAVGIDKREKISAGKIVKAIILNGLGFVSKPLYLFPQFFQDKPVEHLLKEREKVKRQLEKWQKVKTNNLTELKVEVKQFNQKLKLQKNQK